VIELDPEHAGAYRFLGMTFVAADQPEKAISCYEQAVRIRPQWAAAINDLGVALARLGRMNEAVDCFDRALKIDPDNHDAQANMEKARP